MPWYDGLPPETFQKLRDRHPGLSFDREMPLAAIRHPGYAEEFARLGVEVLEYDPKLLNRYGPEMANRPPEDFPRVYFHELVASAVRDLMVAALLSEPEIPSSPESPPKKRVREPDKLETETVDECAAKLRKRAAIRAAGGRVPHELTLEGIGEMVDFDRERVRQIEQLMKLGWPLQKRHPDFSAEDGFVRLPSVDKAASALGLSDAEKAARLAKKSLPLT